MKYASFDRLKEKMQDTMVESTTPYRQKRAYCWGYITALVDNGVISSEEYQDIRDSVVLEPFYGPAHGKKVNK